MGKPNSSFQQAGAVRLRIVCDSPVNLTSPNSPQLPTSSVTSLPSEEVFYDALEDFEVESNLQSPHELTPANALHSFADTEPGGAEKGCTSTCTSAALTQAPVPPKAPVASGPTTTIKRGSSKATALSSNSEAIPVSPIAQPQAKVHSSTSPRLPQKKAVLIGLNYNRFGNYAPLRYAADDAHRFAAALTKFGYPEENMKVVTDEEGQPFASSEYLIECMNWLVKDSSEGDRLFFVFSGHCEPPKIGRPEPCLVAADLMTIPRSTFQEQLVSKVPAGVELTIVLDCCNAAGMVKLKYCIGRMGYKHEIMPTTELEALSELEQPASLPTRGPPRPPQCGSLYGLRGVGQSVPSAPSPPVTLGRVNQAPVALPKIQLRRGNGVVAARPLPAAVAPGQVPESGLISSFVGKTIGLIRPPVSTAVKRPNPAQRRQLVVEAPFIQQTEETPFGSIPAGKVVVWAGTGERQKAFEASGGVKNGIITNAICDVIEKSPVGNKVTNRELWDSVVLSVDKENVQRNEIDAKRDTRPPLSLRTQCAELLVSQPLPLDLPLQILDECVDSPSTPNAHETTTTDSSLSHAPIMPIEVNDLIPLTQDAQ